MTTVLAFNTSPHVLIEDIDGLLACYSRLTGQTHILDAFPAEILRLVKHEPKTPLQIREYLAGLIGEGDAGELGNVEAVLQELGALQLLESSPL